MQECRWGFGMLTSLSRFATLIVRNSLSLRWAHLQSGTLAICTGFFMRNFAGTPRQTSQRSPGVNLREGSSGHWSFTSSACAGVPFRGVTCGRADPGEARKRNVLVDRAMTRPLGPESKARLSHGRSVRFFAQTPP